MLNIENFITSVKIRLLQRLPWYGHVLSQLPIVYSDKDVSTLGVGKSCRDDILVKLYVNPNYIEKVIKDCNKDEEKVSDHFIEVMKHEVLHLLFSHITLGFPDKSRQTIACELSVNSYIDRQKLVPDSQNAKAGVFPEDFNLKPKLGVKEYYDLLNSNKEYEKLAKNEQKELAKLKEIFEGMGKGNGDNSDVKSNGCNGGSGNTIDSHEKWKAVEGDGISEEMVKDIVRQASEICKQMGQWGSMPGDLIEAINGCYKSQKNIIPWQVVLRNFLASSSENVLDYTMKRKSKRFDTRPGTKKEDVLSVAIGIDTSGSISDEMLGLFFSELEWMSKTGTKITVFEWDTRVNKEYDFKDFDGTVTGRGGTNPIPVLEEVSGRRFDCLIMFTDLGFAKIEDHYGIPMLWVVDIYGYCGFEKANIPVRDGIILKMNHDRDGFELLEY